MIAFHDLRCWRPELRAAFARDWYLWKEAEAATKIAIERLQDRNKPKEYERNT